MVPPLPSDLICSGPVTRAATSSRLSSSAWFALNARLSRVLPPEKVTEPLPVTVPLPGVAPLICEKISCGPEKRAWLATLLMHHAGDRAFEPRVLGA